MNLDRALRVQQDFTHYINSIYSEAAHFHYSHDKLLEKLSERIWNSPEYKKAPRWLNSYLSGYRDCKHSYFQKEYLVFGYVYLGEFFETWESYPESLKDIIRNNNHDSEIIQSMQGLYYKGSFDRFF